MNILKSAMVAGSLYLASSFALSQDIPNDIAHMLVAKSPPQYIIERDVKIDSTDIHQDFQYLDMPPLGFSNDDQAVFEYSANNKSLGIIGHISIHPRSMETHISESLNNKITDGYDVDYARSGPAFMDELLNQVSNDTLDDAVLMEKICATKIPLITESTRLKDDRKAIDYMIKHYSRIEYSLNPKDTSQAHDHANVNLKYVLLDNGDRTLKISIDYLFHANSVHLTYRRDLNSGRIVDIKAVAVVGDDMDTGFGDGEWSVEFKDMNFIERFLSSSFIDLADDLEEALDKDLAYKSGCEHLKMRLRGSYIKVVPILKLMKKGEKGLDSLLNALR